MTAEPIEKLPSAWWTWVRLAAILVTIWMAIGFFVIEHSFNTAGQLAASRSEQAAELAGVPLASHERAYLGALAGLPQLGSGDRADQIVAIGSLAAFESDRASDSIAGMIATATAGVGSLVVFLAGFRDWIRRHQSRKKRRAYMQSSAPTTQSPSPRAA
jgi:hypothetical protein